MNSAMLRGTTWSWRHASASQRPERLPDPAVELARSHAWGPNLTEGRRRVLHITYNRRSAGDHRVRYYADKRASFPPDIERDPTRTYTFRV